MIQILTTNDQTREAERFLSGISGIEILASRIRFPGTAELAEAERIIREARAHRLSERPVAIASIARKVAAALAEQPAEIERTAAMVADLAPEAQPDRLPDGRAIEQGDEITISSQGEISPGGRFTFRRIHPSDGSVTCWGPINGSGSRAQWRNFRPERVRTIHRSRKARSAA